MEMTQCVLRSLHSEVQMYTGMKAILENHFYKVKNVHKMI